MLENPDYVQSCSSSPLFSCGSALNTPQAEVFGFPNPILGVAGFAVVTTVGMAWAVTLPIFWYSTLHNVRAGHLPVPELMRRGVNAVANYHGAVLTGWFILLVALILKQFWTYWSGLVS